MSGDFIIRLIFGHIVGDYLLQNIWMAVDKKKEIIPCIIHCLIYTISICVFIFPEIIVKGILDIIFILILVFMSHYILDAATIVDKFLHLIGGRSWDNTKDLANKCFSTYESNIIVSYTVLVHAGIDNGLHLIMLYFIFKFML